MSIKTCWMDMSGIEGARSQSWRSPLSGSLTSFSEHVARLAPGRGRTSSTRGGLASARFSTLDVIARRRPISLRFGNTGYTQSFPKRAQRWHVPREREHLI